MAILQNKPATADEAARLLTPMIAKMAHKYARNHRGRDFDDLMQDGYEGLMKAYHCYDDTRGMAFSSHVYKWAWAHIKDRAMAKWKDYNHTSGVPVEEHNLGEYEMPLDVKIDFDRVLERSDPTTRAIIAARRQGFNFREISEALGALGKPMTLHQVRRKYLEAIEE